MNAEPGRAVRNLALGLLPAWLGFLAAAGAAAAQTEPASRPQQPAPAATLEETRLAMGKWIETQQIIARERKDWQQGKEILDSRLELVRKEIALLEEKIQQAQASVVEAERKRDEARAENERLKAVAAQLADVVGRMEVDVRRLFRVIPEPIQTRLQPLYARIPEDAGTTRVAVAERFQNVLGILNDVNKANKELSVAYEVHTLADGKPSEVKAIYVGLAQAYYVSAKGEAGIGRPGAEGWKWEPAKGIAGEVLTALEIIQGKHTPGFVPLPVKVQ